MEIKINPGENLIVRNDDEKIQLSCSGNQIYFKSTYETNIREMNFDDAFEKLKAELSENTGFDENTTNEIFEKLRIYIEKLKKITGIDKSILLQGIEKNRDYSFVNYYNHMIIRANLEENEILKNKISELNKTIFDLKDTHNKEIVEWQKKVQVANNISVEENEVETAIDYSVDCHANCPFCDSWEDIDLSDYEHDGDFETNHECSRCGKYFSVRAER